MSGPARLLFYVGVFCCFAPIGLVGELTNLGQSPWPRLVLSAAMSGGLAIVYAAAAISHRRLIPVAVAATVIVMLALNYRGPAPPHEALSVEAVASLRQHLTVITVAVIASIVVAYVAFVQVLQREGARFARTQAEIDLAREIHQALVPALDGQAPGLEWRGRSQASGAVGGDLVDVIADEREWIACVADVSGHGVAAGVFMGMFKTALRSARGEAVDAGELLTRVHQTLLPMKPPQTFVTAVCLRRRTGQQLECVLAGHPPILHLPAAGGRVRRLGDGQIAIGMVDETVYTARPVEVSPGDLLAVITDGVTEVFDKSGREYGLEGVEATLESVGGRAPLADIERAILDASRAFGPQLDDRTLLLVRITS